MRCSARPRCLCNRCAYSKWRTHSGVKAKIAVKRNARSHKMWIEHGTNKLVLSKINDLCFVFVFNAITVEWRKHDPNWLEMCQRTRWIETMWTKWCVVWNECSMARQWPVWIAWLRHLYCVQIAALSLKTGHAAHWIQIPKVRSILLPMIGP